MKSTRREFLGFLGFAVGTAALFTAGGKVPAIANPSDEPISRPPGALEEDEFLARCMRCKQCIYACMNNTKQEESPSSNVLFAMPLTRGLTLVNTPLRDETENRCTGCHRCGQVCPSGAIGGEVNVAQVLAEVCVGCFKCTAEGVCPVTPEPAIVADMETGYPKINHDICTGCGACAVACTENGLSEPKPAIVFVAAADIIPLPPDNINRKVAWVMPTCHACNNRACARFCTYGAILQAPAGEKAVVNYDLCVGCGACVENCTWRPDDIILIPKSELAARQAAAPK